MTIGWAETLDRFDGSCLSNAEFGLFKKKQQKKTKKKTIILVHQTPSLAVSDASRTSVDKVEKEFKVAIGSLWKN